MSIFNWLKDFFCGKTVEGNYAADTKKGSSTTSKSLNFKYGTYGLDKTINVKVAPGQKSAMVMTKCTGSIMTSTT